MESVVCFDSRQNGGKDLINKELSWLIWQVTKDYEYLQFVTIMDCCHSGKITRSKNGSPQNDKYQYVRQLDEREDKIKATELLGFKDYIPEPDNRYSPPLGRQILVAAAAENEKAQGVHLSDSEQRGAFTYSLIELLEQNSLVTYEEIIEFSKKRLKEADIGRHWQTNSTSSSNDRK